MNRTTILVAEDDDRIRRGLVDVLESEGYAVVEVANGTAALVAYAEQRPDLMLLDVMMPGHSGYDVCREVRRSDPTTPVILLTAKGEEIDKVVGLELGADDYVTKPFGVRELLARIAAVLRRSGAESREPPPPPLPDLFRFGSTEVDRKAYRARRDGATADLTARELKLLEIFYLHPGQVLSRNDLLTAGWGIGYAGTTRTLDQHIAQLRKKVEPDPGAPRYLTTVHGVGYRYQP